MVDEVVTKQELIDAQKDAQSLETAVNGADNEDVLTRLGEVYPTIAKAVKTIIESGGYEPFQTQAALLASVPTIAKKAAIALDTKKIWFWNGSSWLDSGSTIKASAIGTANLNDVFVDGLYFQSISGNATTEKNYPPNAIGVPSTMLVIAMSTNTIQQIVFASGKIATRMIFNASTTPVFNEWGISLNSADKTSIDASINTVDSARKELAVWSVSGTSGKISVDKASKTLSWDTPLIAAFAKTTRRISIPAASFTFVNAYDTLFLDLSQVPVDGNITAELLPNCLKIAKYSDSAATAFTHKSTQLPLAQLNPQREIVSCPGFVDIDSGGKVKDTFSYNKIADRINIYLPASNGNLINYLLRHDVKAFDPLQTQSQLDMWRLERAIEVNGSLTTLQEIVTYGEWEFTMREKEYPADHVGGVHGDELLTSAYFLVDGVYKDAVSWTGSGEAKEIRLQMQSVIYRLNTQVEIADHYKELVITKNGITANQWVETRLQMNLDRFWLAMMPTNRVASNSVQVSTRDIRNGVVRDVSSAGFTPVYTPLKNGSYVNVSGDKYSTSVEISNLEGVLETADIYVSNDAAYNKIYVSAIGGASSGVTLPTETKISWTAKYKVDAI